MSQLAWLNCCFVEPVGRRWFFFFSFSDQCHPKPQVPHKILHLVKTYNLISRNIWGNPQETILSCYYSFLYLLHWYISLLLAFNLSPPMCLELRPQTPSDPGSTMVMCIYIYIYKTRRRVCPAPAKVTLEPNNKVNYQLQLNTESTITLRQCSFICCRTQYVKTMGSHL